MENTNCIICSRKDYFPFIEVNDRLNKSSKIFHLRQCSCGFIYLNPRPIFEEIRKYYQIDNYDPHSKSLNTIKRKVYCYAQKLTLRWKYKIIRKYFQDGSLLDVGGGKGEFVEYFRRKGWNVILQDSIISNTINKNITFIRELSDLKTSAKFDVITLWHSLEHIHNINNLFDCLNNLLKDSGILLIAVPNINAPERKFYKDKWAPYDAPRHLYHFNLDRLNALCQKKGFDIIQKYSLFQDMPYNILLSAPNFYPYQIFKASFVLFYSLLYTMFAGPEYSSSLLIVCRKSS